MIDERKAVRLLVFEDDTGDMRLLQEMLSESPDRFAVTTVERLQDGLLALKDKSFDIILLDLNLPDSWGMDTLRTVFAHAPEIPIIVLTGLHDDAVGMQTIAAGAQDYLVKGQFDPLFLFRTIQFAQERKKSEKALQESEHRYKCLFDSCLDCIYKMDRNGIITDMNQAGAKMFGYASPEEMIGLSDSIFWVDPAERIRFIDTLRRDKAVERYQIRLQKKNRDIIYAETSSRIQEDEHGAFLGNEGVLRDVTERQKLEEQLLQSQKIEAIGTLAGGVAHDFNNILTAIIGYTYVVLMKMDKNDPLHYELQQVIAAADRATLLTQSLLAFSRKQEIHPAPLDLNDVIVQFKIFISRLIRADIELQSEISSEKLIVMADKALIEHSLMNIVTNAQDAMPNGGRLLITTSRVRLEDLFIRTHGYGTVGDYALITLSDTGCGMDNQTMQKIFEPFFTTKEPGKGTGLGLALVYGTVKKHDGFVDVYSEPGTGTTFKIYLPLIGQSHTGNAEVPTVMDVASAARGTETILIADDDDMVRQLTETIFADHGYHVVAAVDGIDAVQKFVEHRSSIRLVVLDAIMPRKNGKEAYEEIMALDPNVPVIFMSGYAEGLIDKKKVPGKELTFMMKPIPPNDLLRTVRGILDSHLTA